MADLILPNPTTPMAFLPPNLAFQVTTASYILVGSCGVFIWDIIDTLSEDYRLLTKHDIGIPTVVYFISRLGSLGYILGSTIFATASITNDCHHFDKIVSAFYPLAIPPTALLFLFRIRAVFDRNKYVVVFFVAMWLAVLAGCIAVSQGVTGANIGSTRYCINVVYERFAGAGGIIPLVNDTFVFLAISWRLMMNAHTEVGLQTGMKALMFGDYLPAFSKTIFQDGQAYYLTTVTTNMIATVMFYITSIPPAYRSMFSVTNTALMNIMACRVYRKTKFGLFRESAIAMSYSTKYQAGQGTNSFTLPLRASPQITTEVITDRDSDTTYTARSQHSSTIAKSNDWV